MVCLLGVAIGAASAMVGIVSNVLLRPVPGRDPNQVLAIGGLASGAGLADPVTWWKQAPGIDALALCEVGDVELSGTSVGSTRWVRATAVAGELFDVFGVRPVYGRLLSRRDERENARVAVVRMHLWHDISEGRHLEDSVDTQLGGNTYRIVGVLGDDFSFPSVTDVWVPRTETESLRLTLVTGVDGLPPARGQVGWVARPKAGVHIAELREQLASVLANTNAVLTPKTGIHYGDVVGVARLSDVLTRAVRPQLLLVVGATVLMIVLGLGNGCLFALTESAARGRDIAVRMSLGASPRDLRWDCWADATLMATLCTSVSLMVSVAFVHLGHVLLLASRTYVPSWSVVLPESAAASVACGVVVSAVAVLPAMLVGAEIPLLEHSSSVTARLSKGSLSVRAGRVLLGTVACVSTVLVVGSAVTTESLYHLRHLDLGHPTEGIVAVRVVLDVSGLDKDAADAVRRELIHVAASNGSTVALASSVPVTGAQRGYLTVTAGNEMKMAAAVGVEGEYFGVMRVPLVAGKDWPLQEGEIVINRSLATALFGDDHAVGGQAVIGGVDSPQTVIGIVADTRTTDQGDASVYELYRSLRDVPQKASLVRSPVEVLISCSSLCDRAVLQAPDLFRQITRAQVARIATLSHLVAGTRVDAAIAATLWFIYGALAVAISLVSVATVVAQEVMRRSVETAIRGALGATPLRLIVGLSLCSLRALIVGAAGGVLITCLCATALQATTRLLKPPGLTLSALAAVAVIAVGAFAAIGQAWRGTRHGASTFLATGRI